MQLRQQNTDYWEERAEKVLSHFHYQFPDEIDMYDICWRYGIRILPLDDPFTGHYVENTDIAELKSFSIPKGKGRRGIIFLKEDLGAIEKKLLLAEEFCHLYAHHSPQLASDKYLLAKNENQAKRMAAYLLMPARFLATVYDAAMEETVMIADIADHFLVTEKFVYYRMELIFNRRVDAVIARKGVLGTLEWLG